MIKKYTCLACSWTGLENELEYDVLDTCFGDDKVEMCPQCGSYEIRPLLNEKENDMNLS